MSTKPNTNQITYDTGSNKQDLNSILDTVVPIADYAALRNYSGRATQVRITADGIAGFFKYDPTDTTSTDNGGTVIVADTKRWKRIFDGSVNVKWFGAKGDGVTDDTAAIQAAINYANGVKKVYFPYGVYKITKTIYANIAGTHLYGETNAFTYGVGPKSVIIRSHGFESGDTRKVMIDTYANPTDYPTISNVPYVTMENISLDGNNIALVGYDGGFVTTHKNCTIVRCTPTGGVGYRIGKGQTSSHENCAYNGNYDGVTNTSGGTLYFDACVTRQNIRYGYYGVAGGCTFSNVIFESNGSKGLYITSGALTAFRSCYWEQNDASLGGVGANIQIEGTPDNNGLVFDNCISGSTGNTLCAVINGGNVIFKECSHVGSLVTHALNISISANVIVDNSFNTALLPSTAVIVPKIKVDDLSAMRVGSGQIVINSPSMIFGTADFAINIVLAPNYSGVTIRDLIYGNNGAFQWVMSGSANGMSAVNFFKVGNAAFKEVACVNQSGTPTMLTYVRASSVGYVYKNGQLLESFPDTNDYSVTQSLIGKGTLQSDLYEYAVWKGSSLTNQSVFGLWKAGGNAFRAGLTPTFELDFTNRVTGRVINRAAPRSLAMSGDIYWLHPRLQDYFSYPPSSVSGTLDLSGVTGDKFGCTIAGNVTSITFPTSSYDGKEFLLHMVQGGASTITGWPASVKLQGGSFTLTVGSGKTDTLRFIYRVGDGYWLETARSQNC